MIKIMWFVFETIVTWGCLIMMLLSAIDHDYAKGSFFGILILVNAAMGITRTDEAPK